MQSCISLIQFRLWSALDRWFFFIVALAWGFSPNQKLYLSVMQKRIKTPFLLSETSFHVSRNSDEKPVSNAVSIFPETLPVAAAVYYITN